MRPKVVTVILLLAVSVLCGAVLIPRLIHPASAGVPVESALASPDTTVVVPPKAAASQSAMAGSPTQLITVAPVANQETNTSERVAELMALAMNDDANSLATIWSELSNPNKEIRAGALAAVVQFGDPSVVPRLREWANQTEDLDEKIAILAAAKQLELPPLTEGKR